MDMIPYHSSRLDLFTEESILFINKKNRSYELEIDENRSYELEIDENENLAIQARWIFSTMKQE